MRHAIALACSTLLCGCGVQVLGDFDGVPFTPDGTVMAVADRHDLLLRDGSVIAVKKNEGAQTLHLLLTAARLDTSRDWRSMPAQELLEYQRELATTDGLLLKDVPIAQFQDGQTLRAVVKHGVASGDFDVAVAQALPPGDSVAEQGLGARITVTVTPRELDVQPRSGSLEAQVEIKREREAGQDGDVGTGSVTLTFSAPLSPERLTEADLSVAEPILRCMQQRGPAGAASCRGEDPLPTVDATGSVP